MCDSDESHYSEVTFYPLAPGARLLHGPLRIFTRSPCGEAVSGVLLMGESQREESLCVAEGPTSQEQFLSSTTWYELGTVSQTPL